MLIQLSMTCIYSQKDSSALASIKKDSLKFNGSLKDAGHLLNGNKSQNGLNANSLKNAGTAKDLDKDSLVKAKASAQKDRLKQTLKDKLSLPKDSLHKKDLLNKLKHVFPTGTISAGYDYGFLPYTVNTTSPASAFKAEGCVGVDVFNIPVDVTFFYSTQKNLIGLNNYFRVSYNADRYKEKLNGKLNGNSDVFKSQLGGLSLQKQQLMQKMAYTDYLSSIDPDKWPIQNPLKADSLKGLAGNIPQKPDTSGLYSMPDTAGIAGKYKSKGTKGSSGYASKSDSIKDRVLYYKHKTDSVKQLYDDYKGKYDLLNDSIKNLQQKINDIDSLNTKGNSKYLSKLPYFSKVQNFLSGVKKLELGLCYPSYSTFLTSNVPVKGINFEYQKNNFFLAFTYGTTVSTLLYNPKNIDGFIQNVRNSYNYFDYNDLSAGRKIISAKFGIGTKENNHIFAGFLIGKGLNSYLYSSTYDASLVSRETNLVLEADVRQKLFKNTFLDVIAGKSSVQGADLNMETIKTAAKELFSDFRSYAFLTRLSTRIPLTKSSLSFSVRWVDPFFKSFGIGFIRSDNMRYEAKLDQPLGKSLRYTGAFRYEEDNLLKLLNYKNTFYSINNTLSYRIKKGLMLRIGYTPLIRELNGDNYHIKNRNSITTGVITFTPKARNKQIQMNLLYNYYLVNTDTMQINFQNVAYYHQVTFKGGFKTGLNISWFKNNLSDSLNNNIFLGVLDVGYQFKNGSSVSVAGKSAYKLNGQVYPGFIVKGSIRVYKSLFWENQIEKFIVGDLFNGYDLDRLQKFPYYCSTRVILNF